MCELTLRREGAMSLNINNIIRQNGCKYFCIRYVIFLVSFAFLVFFISSKFNLDYLQAYEFDS